MKLFVMIDGNIMEMGTNLHECNQCRYAHDSRFMGPCK